MKRKRGNCENQEEAPLLLVGAALDRLSKKHCGSQTGHQEILVEWSPCPGLLFPMCHFRAIAGEVPVPQAPE